MSRNFFTVLGRIGKEPELKELAGGKKVLNFSLAEQVDKEKTFWHNCQAWDKVAENIHKYFKKGERINIRGSVIYDEYEKDGVKRTFTKINVFEFDFIESKGAQSTENKAVEPTKKNDFDDLDDLGF